MSRALRKRNHAHITAPLDSTALRARCVESQDEPTEVIPAALLLRLLAEMAAAPEGLNTDLGVPRFEVVELESQDVIFDDSAFENAFEEILGADAGG